MFNSKTLWYVVLVKNGKETSVKEQILEKEKELLFEDFIIPETPKDCKENDEIFLRYQVFSGYVFLKFIMTGIRYNVLLQMENVYRFLGTISTINDRVIFYTPSFVPEQQIKNVRRYLKGEQIISQKNKSKTAPLFHIGDKVQITSGDLASIQGQVVSVSNNYACITPEMFFGQTIKVPLEKLSLTSK